ncbi:membrane protein [Mycobacterium phage MalagasyRose]|uniref:Membrane protein n=1 Tax=Mycobacterium phage MalagasyRose TaxID=2599870 RepID=A0A5J6TD97_9CAUD|nr:membrane protein [Mycobacterium phage MalagasyRose]QFG08891.1 membrane protein [Mycobacterium phage MalagasyRose]
MGIGALAVVTLACVVWSLWIRRVTWSCRWEVAATLNVALQGAAVVLMSPWASETLGVWLFRLTGSYNIEDYLAHDCYVVAASAILFNVVGRTHAHSALQRSFRLRVELPATLCIPLMLATFTISNGADVYRSDFFTVPTDFWLNMYWLILCAMLMYLLGSGVVELRALREDPRSRPVATAYAWACLAGMLACVVRLATAFVPQIQHLPLSAALVWLPACVCGAVFAVVSGRSWAAKVRWLKEADSV